jgi:ligand-binding sensor domain-containing protein
VLQTLRHDQALAGSLAIDTLKPMLLDRAGLLWVGTWGAGLQRLNTNNTMLRLIRHSPKRPNSLSYPDVWSILELADGRLFFGSRGNGIDIFDRQQGLVGGYRPDQSAAGALPDGNIIALVQSRDGSVWAGTQQAGVVRQLPGSTAWVAVPGLPQTQIVTLFASRDGSLWAGTTRGVARWQQAGQSPGRFIALDDAQGKPMQASIHAFAEDAEGRVWIGTEQGLWLHEVTAA